MKTAFALMALLTIGCAPAAPVDDLDVVILRPRAVALKSGITHPETLALATVADDGSYGRFYISSDRGADSPGRESPIRLSMLVRIGGVRSMPEEAALIYRDKEAGVDCSDFDGIVEWIDDRLEVSAVCKADRSVKLVATLKGDYVRMVSGR